MARQQGKPSPRGDQTLRREIERETPLCGEDGRLNLNARGWARQPVFVDNIAGYPLRKKRWDYWCVVGPRFLFSATLAHVDYLGMAFAYVFDHEAKRMADCGTALPFARQPLMPPRADQDLAFRTRALDFDFRHAGAHSILRVEAARCGGKPLRAEIEILRPPGLESLNVVVPWSDTRFQFTSKQLCLPARGAVEWGNDTYSFDAGDCWAVRDYGRGVWPYRTRWNWAALCAPHEGGLTGVNLGGQWTDGTGATENGVIVNGRLEKIFTPVRFAHHAPDWLEPWRIATADASEVDLEFTPFYDRKTAMNLGVLASEVHQCFGRFNGSVRTERGTHRIDNAFGWAEEHHARW